MTQNAWKWGVAPREYQDSQSLLKSAFTPLDPVHPAMNLLPGVLQHRKLIEDWQRHFLAGFTTRELQELDVITNRPFNTSPLTQDILPIMNREKWRLKPDKKIAVGPLTKKGLVPSKNIGQGFWDAKNDLVWDHLRPILQLTSLLVNQTIEHPWFDAIINASKEDVEPHRFAPESLLANSLAKLQRRWKVFRLRQAGANKKSNTKNVAQLIMDNILVPYLSFGFFSKSVNPKPEEMPDEAATGSAALTSFGGTDGETQNIEICEAVLFSRNIWS